ncbi:hypothetical protein F2Q68_00034229 [Brassica cretica]|uniref:Uncharacterized protein n=1 Tax=Brassica cretica TaxID=69181 RepID=A0A3N6QAQ2_BRACR|nr:hypothetical protein F2Q68_00034229 [Brassica cretica]
MVKASFYTPLPRLARAASSVNGLSSTSSMVAEAVSNHDPLVDAHQRLIGEVRASSRWELMKECQEKRVEHWDLFLSGGIDQQSGSFSWVATPKSVVGLRFSEEPSF